MIPLQQRLSVIAVFCKLGQALRVQYFKLALWPFTIDFVRGYADLTFQLTITFNPPDTRATFEVWSWSWIAFSDLVASDIVETTVAILVICYTASHVSMFPVKGRDVVAETSTYSSENPHD